MWHRYAAASVLTLVSIIAINPIAKAQNMDVPFSGTLPERATFMEIVPGETEQPTINSPGASLEQIESVTPAQVSVHSSSPATITVSPPALVSGPTPDPPGTIHIGFLRFGSTELRSDVGGGTAPLPSGETNLDVDMLVERPEPFAPGTYLYEVTLTITP